VVLDRAAVGGAPDS